MKRNDVWHLQFFEGRQADHLAHESIVVEPLPVERRSMKDVLFLSVGDVTVEKNGDKISLTRTGIVGRNGDAFDFLPGELVDVVKLLLQFDIEQKVNNKK